MNPVLLTVEGKATAVCIAIKKGQTFSCDALQTGDAGL